MPIYEYRCPECETTFEQRRAFGQADDPLSCPQCESPQVERMLSSFMFAVHGSSETLSAGPVAGSGCACGGACSCAA